MVNRVNKKRIIFISYEFYPPYYSGKLLMSHIRFTKFDPEKVEVIVLTRDVEGLPSENVFPQYHFFKSRNFGEGKILRRLNAVFFWYWVFWKLKKIKTIDVIHFDEPATIAFPIFKRLGYRKGWASFTKIARWAKKAGIPTFYEYATSDISKDFDPGKDKLDFLSQVDWIVSVSNRLNDAVSEQFPDKALLAPCGIQDDIFHPIPDSERQKIREASSIENSDVLFSFVGLLVHRKGVDLICNAFNELCEERDDVRLWLIGPQNEAESRHVHNDEVERYKATLGKNIEKVTFFGNISDRKRLASLVGASDVFLFPTRREGFGLAPVEAMACGVPPIIARIEGITDLVNIDGETGLYIRPDNLSELFNAMKRLATDQELRNMMSIAAHQRVKNEFSASSHAEIWYRFYTGKQ